MNGKIIQKLENSHDYSYAFYIFELSYKKDCTPLYMRRCWNDFAKSSSIVHTYTYFSYLCDLTFDYRLISGDLFPPAGFEFSIKAIMPSTAILCGAFDKIWSEDLVLASTSDQELHYPLFTGNVNFAMKLFTLTSNDAAVMNVNVAMIVLDWLQLIL